jgi:triosephosphate isomerase
MHIPIALMSLRDGIEIAAQNCSLTGCGAYTGEIAASQLKDMGVTWVILGHPERREGFGMAGEDSELVAKKTKKAIEEGLKVMFCIGEKKEEREAGATPEMAQETHANIRAWVAENVGQDVADAVPIQYGGSMKGANVADLLAQADIDGGLIGGASLTMDFFNVLEVNSWCKE